MTITAQLWPRSITAGTSAELVIEFQIAPPWELRALEAHTPSAATRLDLELPDGIIAADAWQAPQPELSIGPEGYAVYRGTVRFGRTIRAETVTVVATQQIQCRIDFTVCDGQRCVRYQGIELVVELNFDAR